MKRLSFLLAVLALFIIRTPVHAQVHDYTITNFNSKILINQDSSITVTEQIEVNFQVLKHGIYRTIPVIYSADGKSIDSHFDLLSIKDSGGNTYKYTTNRSGNNIQIRIGDEKKLLIGNKTYVISYRMRNILQNFDSHVELYWNVSGNDWDTTIQKISADVTSNYANIIRLKCMTGSYGQTGTNCRQEQNGINNVVFFSTNPFLPKAGLTVVVHLNKDNALVYTRSFQDLIKDYWLYPVSVLSLPLMLFFWFKKGRDQRFITDNIYYETTKDTESTPVFWKREFLPLVYSPIQGLTPSEVGTLLDEKVDIHDVIAEITELGRLGYLTIEKVNKKFAKDDYLLKRTAKKVTVLRDYQSYLLEELFSLGEVHEQVAVSELKKKFYPKLESFKNKLYDHVKKQGYFPARPDRVRALWIGIAFAICLVTVLLSFNFFVNTLDYIPLVVSLLFVIPSLIIAYQMPRKTAKGYALHRQIKGLEFYLGKGKWREEIKEKHLFLDEILPLAISLGVVGTLARDMKDIGINAPSYFKGNVSNWPGVISGFNTSAASSFVQTKSSSGGWSGGSGGGGFSGGGFGGGGGGSW